MEKKVLKIIKTIAVTFFIAILLISLVVSQNDAHIEFCDDEDCIYCTIILIMQKIINLSINYIIAVIIGILIYLFLSKLHNVRKKLVQLSLIFQKVQMNE